MSRRTPGLQTRSNFQAYWGIYASAVLLPNGSANPQGLPFVGVGGQLETGDTAYVTGSGLYVCTATGTAGGGNASWRRMDVSSAPTEIEIDFGVLPAWSQEFVIVDALVSSSSRVIAWQSSAPATGRVGNDTAWDQLLLATAPGTGQFALTAYAMPGPVVGKRKIIYQVA